MCIDKTYQPLTGDARPRFFDALLEEQVRRARSAEALTVGYQPTNQPARSPIFL